MGLAEIRGKIWAVEAMVQSGQLCCFQFDKKKHKMLSYRRETTLQGALHFSPKVEDWNWETIFYGHYRSIFNHCDIIGLKICRIP